MTDVECCVNNLDSETWRTLTTNPRVNQQHCLRRCGVCHDQPFLVVDGDVVVGANHATLLRRVDRGATADGDGGAVADGDGGAAADGDGGAAADGDGDVMADGDGGATTHGKGGEEP